MWILQSIMDMIPSPNYETKIRFCSNFARTYTQTPILTFSWMIAWVDKIWGC